MTARWWLIGVGLLLSVPAAGQDRSPRVEGTIVQIEADGVATFKPDTMWVSASVVTTGRTAAQALDRNNLQAQRLIDAVKTSGIPLGELQTSELTVTAQFAEADRDQDDSVPVITGYVARNTLEVELTDVATAGQLISSMFEAGANGIRGPSFGLRDPVPAQREAERRAIAAARAEAENYAAALGMRVVRVLRVSDRRFQEPDDGTTIVVTGSRIRATPLEPGDVDYVSTMYAEFLLEPL
jgi:uncharacterized protein YggE